MKRVAFAILAFPLICFGQKDESHEEPVSKGVHFIDGMSWRQIKEKARSEHRFIFVDCFATWCAPCRAMDADTYPDSSVGAMVNENFISVKIQYDTTRNDKKEIIDRYADAHELMTTFHVNDFPTHLFFSPEGELVHKSVGYQTPKDFLAVSRDAMDPSRQYITLLNSYQSGKIQYTDMARLASQARDFGDASLFCLLEGKFMHEYLNHLPEKEYLKTINLSPLVSFLDSLKSDDKVFGWLCRNFHTGDSVLREKGLSEGIVNLVIYRETFKPWIDSARRHGVEPNWDSMGKATSMRYSTVDVNKLILKGKQGWYEYKKDWEKFCAAAIERIEVEGVASDLTDHNLDILNSFAFKIFQKSNDKFKLEKALSWSELTVAAITNSSSHAANWMDTNANLLYKLGRTPEAIQLETKAVERGPSIDEIKETLQKMKNGKKTW